MNLFSLLRDVSNSISTKAAILENGQEITYGELWDRIERLSGAFYKIGIKENFKVVLAFPNNSEFIYCLLALLKINAIISPVSPELTPFELKGIFHNLNPHAIITPSASIEKVINEYPDIFEDKILISQGDVVSKGRAKRHYKLRELYKETSYRINNPETPPEQTATINYTYRGMGSPLGAMLTHSNYAEGVLAYVENTRMAPTHRIMSLLPPFHVYPLVGCTFAPLLCGATVVILRNIIPRAVLSCIENFKVNHFTAVPSIYALLSRYFGPKYYELSSLKCCITGGSYMHPDLQEDIKVKMGLEVYQGYGLTECLPVTWNRFESNRAGSLGLPLRADFYIQIVAEDGKKCETGQVGEIKIQSPTVMQGYLNRKEETGRVLLNRWFYTGDNGYLDKDGYLYFSGLKKNITKVGGNMVDLQEVKDVLLSHPMISRVDVYPKEDGLWGHIIAVKIYLIGNEQLSESDIRSFCSKRLSRHKVPKNIELLARVVKK
jgi:long-chain acyl-CoA synthetase